MIGNKLKVARSASGLSLRAFAQTKPQGRAAPQQAQCQQHRKSAPKIHHICLASVHLAHTHGVIVRIADTGCRIWLQ